MEYINDFLSFLGGDTDAQQRVGNDQAPSQGWVNPAFAPRRRAVLSPVDDKVEAMREGIKEASMTLKRRVAKMARDDAMGIRDIKEAVQRGNASEARVRAKQLAMERRARLRMEEARLRLTSVESTLSSVQATAAIMACARQTVAILKDVSGLLEPQKAEELAQTLSTEMERMGLAQELIDDALDDINGASDDAADGVLSEDAILSSIYEEANLDMGAAMPRTPSAGSRATAASASTPSAPTAVPDLGAGMENAEDEALTKRLGNLLTHSRHPPPKD